MRRFSVSLHLFITLNEKKAGKNFDVSHKYISYSWSIYQSVLIKKPRFLVTNFAIILEILGCASSNFLKKNIYCKDMCNWIMVWMRIELGWSDNCSAEHFPFQFTFRYNLHVHDQGHSMNRLWFDRKSIQTWNFRKLFVFASFQIFWMKIEIVLAYKSLNLSLTNIHT